MKRRDCDPKLIDHRDAKAKALFWVANPDGTRSLYGMKRLAMERGIKRSTLYFRWDTGGRPDEIPASMLIDPEESYKISAALREERKPKTTRSNKPAFLLLPDNTRHTALQLYMQFGVPESTLSTWKKKGETTVTREKLEQSRPKKTKFVEPAPANRPFNINDVIYSPSVMERQLVGLR